MKEGKLLSFNAELTQRIALVTKTSKAKWVIDPSIPEQVTNLFLEIQSPIASNILKHLQFTEGFMYTFSFDLSNNA